jgi:hypothetical protein
MIVSIVNMLVFLHHISHAASYMRIYFSILLMTGKIGELTCKFYIHAGILIFVAESALLPWGSLCVSTV